MNTIDYIEQSVSGNPFIPFNAAETSL